MRDWFIRFGVVIIAAAGALGLAWWLFVGAG